MSEESFDFDRFNLELQRKADFFSRKIWGVEFTGLIEFSNGLNQTKGMLLWSTHKPLITINKVLIPSQLEFSLDDSIVYLLTKWYCRSRNLNKQTDFKKELYSHGVCSNDKFFIHSNMAYTGNVKDRTEWEPTIKLIELNLEFSYQLMPI